MLCLCITPILQDQLNNLFKITIFMVTNIIYEFITADEELSGGDHFRMVLSRNVQNTNGNGINHLGKKFKQII